MAPERRQGQLFDRLVTSSKAQLDFDQPRQLVASKVAVVPQIVGDLLGFPDGDVGGVGGVGLGRGGSRARLIGVPGGPIPLQDRFGEVKLGRDAARTCFQPVAMEFGQLVPDRGGLLESASGFRLAPGVVFEFAQGRQPLGQFGPSAPGGRSREGRRFERGDGGFPGGPGFGIGADRLRVSGQLDREVGPERGQPGAIGQGFDPSPRPIPDRVGHSTVLVPRFGPGRERQTRHVRRIADQSLDQSGVARRLPFERPGPEGQAGQDHEDCRAEDPPADDFAAFSPARRGRAAMGRGPTGRPSTKLARSWAIAEADG